MALIDKNYHVRATHATRISLAANGRGDRSVRPLLGVRSMPTILPGTGLTTGAAAGLSGRHTHCLWSPRKISALNLLNRSESLRAVAPHILWDFELTGAHRDALVPIGGVVD